MKNNIDEANDKQTVIYQIWLVILVCIMCLAVGEIAIRVFWLRHLNQSPSSYDVGRNPFFRRAWPEWTRSVEKSDRATHNIIVISNSQGYFREHPDDGFNYSAILERSLNESSRESWEVLNWSIGGGRISEMIVLASRASLHNPSVIVLSIFSNNLNPDSKLSTSVSDIPLLTALPSVRQYLSSDFLYCCDVNLFRNSIYYYSGYGRLRWRTWLEDGGNTGNWGNRGSQRNRNYIERDSEDMMRRLSALNLSSPEWSEESGWLIREFIETVNRSTPNTKILIVSMPLSRTAYRDEAWIRNKALLQEIQRSIPRYSNVYYSDLIDLIQEDLFISHAHFGPQAHGIMAEKLQERILRIVSENN